jgi:trk system potassium uptake protein TrkH
MCRKYWSWIWTGGPADNFAFFTDTQKFILSIGMIIGRLEFFTVLILLSREFWKKF